MPHPVTEIKKAIEILHASEQEMDKLGLADSVLGELWPTLSHQLASVLLNAAQVWGSAGSVDDTARSVLELSRMINRASADVHVSAIAEATLDLHDEGREAIGAVLDLHVKRTSDEWLPQHRPATRLEWCAVCRDDDGTSAEWPCLTVATIAKISASREYRNGCLCPKKDTGV